MIGALTSGNNHKWKPIMKKPVVTSKWKAMYWYINVNLTCLGAILLVFESRPNQKLFLISSKKNFILLSVLVGSMSIIS